MRSLLSIAFVLGSSAHALPTQEEVEVRAALLRAADLGSDARAEFSAPEAHEWVLGVVLSESRGKLLVLRKQPSGGYRLDAESAVFENNFGPRYAIETVQSLRARRFSIQVNAESVCGIQVETFRLAHVRGVWRVSGYDKAEPDPRTCDVNLRSREYSANLLTHQVRVVEFRNGKAVKRESRVTRAAAPGLDAFHFSMFQDEP